MEELVKSIIEKISSYNIFNNFFPGIIFCYLVEQCTRFSLANGEIIENLFIYYFVGIIISRVGSIFVEKLLNSLKVKNKKTKEKKPYLEFAPYNKYIEASENEPFIATLSETNNVYRTIIALFILVIVVKLYDWIIYDFVSSFGAVGQNLAFIGICFIIIILFVNSYKKQTNYIKSRVEKYCNSKETK
ncbi:hypothetical protein AALA78_02990 [Lachnospiraceae bacterium 42-17]